MGVVGCDGLFWDFSSFFGASDLGFVKGRKTRRRFWERISEGNGSMCERGNAKDFLRLLGDSRLGEVHKEILEGER